MHHLVRLPLAAVLVAVVAAVPARAQSVEQSPQNAPQPSAASAANLSSTTPVAAPALPVLPALPAQTTSADAAPAQTAGAPLDGLRAGVHAKATSRPEARTMAASNANLGQSRALMVVGVAGLIVGAIIGGTPGTLIMVGGALVGLKGLYDYLQ